MITIIDHAYEKEDAIVNNLARIRQALSSGKQVRVYHPFGFIHGRLANIPGVQYEVLHALPTRRGIAIPPQDLPLFNRLTTIHDYSMPYEKEPKGELFIHWYYRDRINDTLSRCEIFHLNMLRYLNVPGRVKCIHIRCASVSGTETDAMRIAKSMLSGCRHIDFKVVPQKPSWEHDTFKEAVEYAISSGEFIYYSHFKGVSHIADPNIIGGYRNGGRAGSIDSIDILYWCYLLYMGLFNAPDGYKAIGPLYFPGKCTLHYSDGAIRHKWAYPCNSHYTGSFQAFDGEFLRNRLNALGATAAIRNADLWRNDPYTVEQFLSLCFHHSEVYSIGTVSKSAYRLYEESFLPEYLNGFRRLYEYDPLCRNLCIANGTYKYIGGTDTFNWALGKAFKDLGFNVYYYAPDMDGSGITEKYLQEAGILPYREGIPLAAVYANQQAGKAFIGKCPVIQTCHSKFTQLEYPIKGARAYVSVSEEIQEYLKNRGFDTLLLRNGIDLNRYMPKGPLRDTPRVLSICQGDDTLLKEACGRLGWHFISVPKEVGKRIWHVEDLINNADIVVGIGRSLYDGMACGRACVSWDNRKLNPYCGCGYVTRNNWHQFAKTNFTGRGYPPIDTVSGLANELSKYRPEDGTIMRQMAERELNAHRNALKYLELAGIEP